MTNLSVINGDLKEIIKETGPELFQLEGKKVLITGASGMLAGYLVRALIHANEFLFKTPAQLYLVMRKKTFPFGQSKFLHYLFLDISQTSPKIKDIDYIIHAASKAAPKIYMNQAIDTINTNILGLYNLLKICNEKTKSFLFFSSAEIYGQPKDNQPIDEQTIGMIDHLNKRSCYIEAKKVCETICMNYFWEKKLPVKIVRIFHTFGPGLNLDDGRVFSDFIKNGLEKKNIEILGDKSIERPLLYVKDATVMFLKILLSSKNGEVYNVANDQNVVSVGKFAEIVCAVFNQKDKNKLKVIIKKGNVNYYKEAVKAIRPDISKFKRDFNYQPKIGVREAVKRTVDYYLK